VKEPYYLTDPDTGRRDPQPEMMEWEEARARNEFLSRQLTRWRWVKVEEPAKGWQYG
jgi:hypothetical protein